MPSLVKSLLLGVGLSQLAYAADGTVTVFRNRDCTGTAMWTGKVGGGTNIVRGGDLHEALSFSYSGYFRLGIWDGTNVGSSKQCAYCSNYHADHSGGGCINVSCDSF